MAEEQFYMKSRQAPENIDDYITQFPPEIQAKLVALRSAIREAVPEASEAISYQIPTFKLHGNLIHFAAYKNHIGLYPAPRGIDEFKDELSHFGGGKGTVRFPHDSPLPLDLIRRIAKFRATKSLERSREKVRTARKK